LMVGAAAAIAVVALQTQRDALSGVAVASGVLVKVTAGLAAIGAAAWAGSRRARRAWVFAAGAVGVVVSGYVPFALQPFRALAGHSSLLSRASLWQLPHVVLGTPVARVLRAHEVFGGVSVLIAALLVAHRRRRDDTPVVAVAGSLASYQAVAPYVLPWYSAWSLPTLALERDARLARWGWWYAAAMAAIFQLPTHASANVGAWEPYIVGALFPAVALVTFIRAVREPRVTRHAEQTRAHALARRP